MTPNEIEQLILNAFTDANVVVESEDNVHFMATIVSDAFQDLTLVKRQQLVYQVLGDKISDGTIHALRLKTLTPSEQ